jgi:glycerol-3-phosphate acyltransferase PlsY
MFDVVVVLGALVIAFAVGSIPFSHLVARTLGGVDLRTVGTGTVSGSGVGTAVGFWPMVAAGLLDIGKGALAVLPLAGSRPVVAAIAGGAAVAGHNWSPWLRAAGGRGIGPAIGGCAVLAWSGSLVLLGGLAAGKLAGRTAVGSFAAQALLPAVAGIVHGAVGVVVGIVLVIPMWAKRIAGNRRPARPGLATRWYRLLHDADPPGITAR